MLNLEAPRRFLAYKPTGKFFKYNISQVLRHGFQSRVPYLIVLVKQFTVCSYNAAFASFKDPYGEMQATIHGPFENVVESF